ERLRPFGCLAVQSDFHRSAEHLTLHPMNDRLPTAAGEECEAQDRNGERMRKARGIHRSHSKEAGRMPAQALAAGICRGARAEYVARVQRRQICSVKSL